MIRPVLLSGGSGTRLWPVSRPARPKQLLPLLGSGTMLQATARRVADPKRFAPPLVVGRAADAAAMREQLAQAGFGDVQQILEPCARNTAPAIALAVLCSPADALLLVLPSDHAIDDVPAFLEAVDRGRPWAEQDWIVTFGIRPDRPETGYGYIRTGGELGGGVFEAASFVEKPDAEAAYAFLKSGDHSWNGGIFLFRAGAMLAAFERHAPDILAAVGTALDGARKAEGTIEPDAAAFAAARAQSIDHAVMEHGERVAVVPVDMGWSDVGSWDAIADRLPADPDGNVLIGDAIAVDSRNCMLRSASRLVVAAGVSDLIVIETEDAILVLPRGGSQRAKDAVEALRARRHPTLGE